MTPFRVTAGTTDGREVDEIEKIGEKLTAPARTALCRDGHIKIPLIH